MKIVFKAFPVKHFSDLPIGATFKKHMDDHTLLYMKVTTNLVEKTCTTNTVVLNNGALTYTSSVQEVIPVNGTWSQEV